MGGGEGSAAREALRHKSMEKVVMCDIDQVNYLQREIKKLSLNFILLVNNTRLFSLEGNEK